MDVRPLGQSLKRNRYFTVPPSAHMYKGKRGTFTQEKPSDQSFITKKGQTDTLCLLMPRSQGAASALFLPKAQNLNKARRRQGQTDPQGGHPPTAVLDSSQCQGETEQGRGRDQGDKETRQWNAREDPASGRAHRRFWYYSYNLSASSKLFQDKKFKEIEKQNWCTKNNFKCTKPSPHQSDY